MKVFLRLGGCLEAAGPAEGALLTRTRWYCLPARAPAAQWEEEADGAIYAVSCRCSPGGQAASDAAPGPSRVLKAGSLPRLVQHLLEAPALGDACFVPAFLATYRAFAAPRAVLEQLLDRLQAAPGSDHALARAELQRALGSLLCSWLDGYPEDFVDLEAGLREQLLGHLRWALGSGSEQEKRLAATPTGGAPVAEEALEEAEAVVEEKAPDPHYVLGLQADEVAAHLTAQDAELFLRLVPHECVGSLWSQRDKKGNEGTCPTVRATVAQFNHVSNAVVTSCLSDTGLRATQRARLLEKWIRVAEECLALRNFSALYAVVSALQSTPLHRLKRTWEETSRECVHCYEELSAICSEEDNFRQSRRLLFQEGCSRAEPAQRKPQWRTPEQRPAGVVPYLGTFLKDLVMLDVATRKQLQNGYINFEKHRKEFEILTRLRLLQAACRNYTLKFDHNFQRWLQRLPRLTETQSYELSCTIEPLGDGGPPTRAAKPSVVITQCTDLLSSIGMGTPVSRDKPGPSQMPPDLLLSPSSSLAQAKWPSVSALDSTPEDNAPSSPAGLAPPPAMGGGFSRGHRRSASCGSAYPTGHVPGNASTSECRFIRVRMELRNGTLYKSVVVTSQDKAPAVITKVLEKHNQDRDLAPNYELVQLLPEGQELAFPSTANVFYAMNSSSLDFVLRCKSARGATPPPLPPPRTPAPRGTDVNATFPKIRATGRRIAKALF